MNFWYTHALYMVSPVYIMDIKQSNDLSRRNILDDMWHVSVTNDGLHDGYSQLSDAFSFQCSENDQDCDGYDVSTDCNDTNIFQPALDQDCDGIPSSEDCDDNDETSLNTNIDDADCDGIPSSEDCDDNDETVILNTLEDIDCNGIIDNYFYLDYDEITIKCPHANVGDTTTVQGVTYTKRDEAGLRNIAVSEDWNALETSCISDVTNLSFLFDSNPGENFTHFNGDIRSWDTSDVTNMADCFMPTISIKILGIRTSVRSQV